MTKKKKDSLQDLRDRIDAAALIDALGHYALGEKEMTASQASVALALLKKALPDLSEPPRVEQDIFKTHEEALRELE